MRIVIAAVYLANHIKALASQHDMLIVSDEPYAPYDCIHLCALVDRSKTLDEISLPLDPTIQLELEQRIEQIDTKRK